MLLRSLFVASALVAGAAHGTTVALERTADLSIVDLSHNLRLEQELPSPIYLNVGDTLDLTLRFAPSQTLQISDPFDIYAWVLVPIDPIEAYFVSDASFSFLEPKGQTPAAPISDVEFNGNSHFGNIIEAAQIGAGPIEFAGVRLTAKVVSFSQPGPLAFRYTAFSFRGMGFSVGVVPEPAIWATMILGIGMTGAACRKRSCPPLGA